MNIQSLVEELKRDERITLAISVEIVQIHIYYHGGKQITTFTPEQLSQTTNEQALEGILKVLDEVVR